MLLEVEGLCKSFKGTQVLKNISFKVAQGEVVSLLGQSGAGKDDDYPVCDRSGEGGPGQYMH